MKTIINSLLLLLLISCNQEAKNDFHIANWDSRRTNLTNRDNMVFGSSYLSVYSEIYDMTDQTTHQLTATVSMRNISSRDTVFISKADYYNTEGDLIRSYINKTIYVKPLETLEIVIARTDTTGGSGANFIFDWVVKPNNPEPLFEAVMIWTTGTQGISFTTRGVKR